MYFTDGQLKSFLLNKQWKRKLIIKYRNKLCVDVDFGFNARLDNDPLIKNFSF